MVLRLVNTLYFSFQKRKTWWSLLLKKMVVGAPQRVNFRLEIIVEPRQVHNLRIPDLIGKQHFLKICNSVLMLNLYIQYASRR